MHYFDSTLLKTDINNLFNYIYKNIKKTLQLLWPLYYDKRRYSLSYNEILLCSFWCIYRLYFLLFKVIVRICSITLKRGNDLLVVQCQVKGMSAQASLTVNITRPLPQWALQDFPTNTEILVQNTKNQRQVDKD